MKKTHLSTFNEGGYAEYRIPGIVCTNKNTLLAYCEARSGGTDWGKCSDQFIRYTDLDESYFTPDFYGSSFYTARFMTQVMRTLCQGREDRFPYVIEGFLIGLISGVISFFLEWGLYNLIARAIGRLNDFRLFVVVPFTDVLIFVAATFGVTGLLVGVLGSIFSIRKFLDV